MVLARGVLAWRGLSIKVYEGKAHGKASAVISVEKCHTLRGLHRPRQNAQQCQQCQCYHTWKGCCGLSPPESRVHIKAKHTANAMLSFHTAPYTRRGCCGQLVALDNTPQIRVYIGKAHSNASYQSTGRATCINVDRDPGREYGTVANCSADT